MHSGKTGIEGVVKAKEAPGEKDACSELHARNIPSPQQATEGNSLQLLNGLIQSLEKPNVTDGSAALSIVLDKSYWSLQEKFTFSVPTGISIITGKNGVGKSHLLDYLMRELGLAFTIDADLISHLVDSPYGPISRDVNEIAQGNSSINIDIDELQKRLIARCKIPPAVQGFGKVQKYRNPVNALEYFYIRGVRDIHPDHNRFILWFMLASYYNLKRNCKVPIWEQINEYLQKLGSVRLKAMGSPDLARIFSGFPRQPADTGFPGSIFPGCVFESNGEQVLFNNLSSGEKNVIALIIWFILERNYRGLEPRKIMVLDEIDRNFHPEFIKYFFSIIKGINKDRKIIITTHNPCTVSLAADCGAKIFIMDRERGGQTIIKEAKSEREAITKLSDSRLTVVEDVNYVIVENEPDAKFYSIVHKKFLMSKLLERGSELLFVPVGVKRFDPVMIKKLQQILPKKSDDSKIKEAKEIVDNLAQQNDEGGGCDQVKKRTQIVKYKIETDEELAKLGIISKTTTTEEVYYIPSVIWGLLDKDNPERKAKKGKGGNATNTNVYEIDVYSFENYLCMPLNLFYAIENQKIGEQKISDLKDQTALQKLTEKVIVFLREAVSKLKEQPVLTKLRKILESLVLEYKNQKITDLITRIDKNDRASSEILAEIEAIKTDLDSEISILEGELKQITKAHEDIERNKELSKSERKKQLKEFNEGFGKEKKQKEERIKKLKSQFGPQLLEQQKQLDLRLSLHVVETGLEENQSNWPELKLANGVTIKCPTIFFEGVGGGRSGHKLIEYINNIIFGDKDKEYKVLFSGLEKIPAPLLPSGLLNIVQNLSWSVPSTNHNQKVNPRKVDKTTVPSKTHKESTASDKMDSNPPAVSLEGNKSAFNQMDNNHYWYKEEDIAPIGSILFDGMQNLLFIGAFNEQNLAGTARQIHSALYRGRSFVVGIFNTGSGMGSHWIAFGMKYYHIRNQWAVFIKDSLGGTGEGLKTALRNMHFDCCYPPTHHRGVEQTENPLSHCGLFALMNALKISSLNENNQLGNATNQFGEFLNTAFYSPTPEDGIYGDVILRLRQRFAVHYVQGWYKASIDSDISEVQAKVALFTHLGDENHYDGQHTKSECRQCNWVELILRQRGQEGMAEAIDSVRSLASR